MTTNPDNPARRLSPRAIREASFSPRRRGVDESEVHRFLGALSDQIEAGDAERARLRAEIEGLRRRLDEGGEAQAINPQAIALFSQAQQVADNLVAEAIDHARALMSEARKQQREILEQARSAVGAAVPQIDEAAAREPSGSTAREVEYVRTFAKVAQVQLRSVLEALTEQVDKLSEVQDPDPPLRSVPQAGPVAPADTYGPVHWRFDQQASPASGTDQWGGRRLP